MPLIENTLKILWLIWIRFFSKKTQLNVYQTHIWWFILTNASIRKHQRLLEVSSLESIGLFGWICHVNMGFNGMKQELLNHWFLVLRWFEWSVPKHSTSVWLFVLDRNPTLERLQRWGLDVETTCLLCVAQPESRDHFFFQVILLFHILELCSVEVKLLSTPHDWDLIFRWLPTASPSPVSSRALIQLWHGTIYGLRMERNRRFNIGLSRDEATILNIIVRMIKNKSTALRNLECRFGDDTVSLWSGI